MGLEAVTFISDLVITNPVGATDPKSQGDDHIRNIKKALKNTFPSFVGVAVSLTEAQINDAARRSVQNTFGATQYISAASSLTLGLAGVDTVGDCWIGFYEPGFVTRKAYMAFGNAGDDTFFLTNEENNADIRLQTTGTGKIYLNTVDAADYARLSVANTFAGEQTISSAAPRIWLQETGVAANNGHWSILANAEQLVFSAYNDAHGAATDFLTIDRTGTTIDLLAFAGAASFSSAVTVAGNFLLNNTSPTLRFNETDAAANNRLWDIFVNSEQFTIRVVDDAVSSGVPFLTVDRTANVIDEIRLSGTSVFMNSRAWVESNTPSTTTPALRVGGTGTTSASCVASFLAAGTNAAMSLRDTTNSIEWHARSNTTGIAEGTITNHPLDFITNNTSRYQISSGGNHDLKTGTVAIGGNLTVAANIRATFGGDMLYTGIISPAGLAASQNDYAPSGHATASVFRLDPNGNTPAVITGLAGGVNGRRITIMRVVGSTGTINFARENAGSTAGNRFANTGADWGLTTTFAALDFIYDGTISRWVPVGGIS